MKLFFNTSAKKYFCVLEQGEGVACRGCGRSIEVGRSLIAQREVLFKRLDSIAWCIACFGSKHKDGDYSEYRVAYVTEVVPSGSVLLSEQPVLLKKSGTDVFSAAWSNEGISADTSNFTIVDRARLAGRTEGSWLGVSVGKPDFKLLNKKDEPLRDEKDAVVLLEDLKDAKPVLPEIERKMIEGKKR